MPLLFKIHTATLSFKGYFPRSNTKTIIKQIRNHISGNEVKEKVALPMPNQIFGEKGFCRLQKQCSK